MLKKFLYICLILVSISCERIFINGDLDGMWRLQRVETENSVEYPDSIFYSFQRHLMHLGIYSETEYPKKWYMGCFEFNGDSLVMDNFYRYPGIVGDSDPKELECLYIYDDTMRFKVDHLSNDELVLSTLGLRYTFIKW